MISNQADSRRAGPDGRDASRSRLLAAKKVAAAIGLTLLLGACASQMPGVVEKSASAPGFWWGLWHGFIFPFAWIGSLFDPDIAVYAVPNRGGWYDFGFFLGITVLGGGSWFSSRSKK